MLKKSNSQGNHTPGGVGKDIGRGDSGSRGGFRLCRRPGRFFRHLAGKLSKAICFKCRTSSRVSSAGGPRQFVTPIDVHRKEAIEDCIHFINHSSSLPRSNSVSV